MKWISYLSVIFINIVILSSVAQAREWFEAYSNARSNALGGIKIAGSSDDTALYTNPASLGSFRGSYVTLVDPEVETSRYYDGYFSSTLTDLEKSRDLILKHPDQYYHVKMQVTPTFTIRKFSFGFIYKNELSAVLDSTGSTLDTQLHNDLGFTLGYVERFFDGVVKFGVTAKLVNRMEVDNAALTATGPYDLAIVGSEGSAVGFDAALQLQAPVKYLPTLAIVARDIGNLEFKEAIVKNTNSINRPNKVLQSIDIGLSFTTIYSKAMRSLLSFEYVDLTNSRQEDFSNKRLHIGLETNWNDILYLRFGMNQMYWTAGLEVASENVSWQLSTYGEEVGTKEAPKEDRRLSTKIIFRM